MIAIQKEYLLRRDTQSLRFDIQNISHLYRYNLILFSVEGLRKQLDENNVQREQLEKIQFNIIEELRSIRNRLEGDSSNMNSLTNEVRQRTRKLEDDHRLTVRIYSKKKRLLIFGKF